MMIMTKKDVEGIGNPLSSGKPIAMKPQLDKLGLLPTMSATMLIQFELGPINVTRCQRTHIWPYTLLRAGSLRPSAPLSTSSLFLAR